MAMHAAMLPSCSHVLEPRLSAVAVQSGLWMVKCDERGLRFRCGVQGRRLGVHVAPLRIGQRCRGGIARAEQAEAGVTTTTASPPETKKGGVTEVDKDTFWPIVQSAGEKVVVLDMYTQWCGPCKMMLPKIIELSETLDDVIFVKLDCNQHNKPLAKELGIRVVPTFKIFKHNKLVGEVTGAKFPDLVTAIEKARKSEPV